MSSEKILNSRIQHKHDLIGRWAEQSSFIPKDGEMIVYDQEGNNYKRLKFGDGSTTIAELDFFDKDLRDQVDRIESDLALWKPVFVGTMEQYNEVRAAGKIPTGAIVIIIDEHELSNSTTAILGRAILGKMILGRR